MEKKYSRTFLMTFAEHCMIKLLSVKPENSDLSEISSYDLWRIHKILNEFKHGAK